MSEYSFRAMVRSPERKARLRRGRGFSRSEIQEAGLTLSEARRLGLYIDSKRRSSWSFNVESLKKFFIPTINIKEIKGIGEATAQKLASEGILYAHDLLRAELEAVSRRAGISIKRLEGWKREAEKILKESK